MRLESLDLSGLWEDTVEMESTRLRELTLDATDDRSQNHDVEMESTRLRELTLAFISQISS